MKRWAQRLSCAAVLICLFCFGCSPRIAHLDSKGKTVICFGDSITEGLGAGPGEDYPSVLSGMIGRPVINAGVSGDTTAEALSRIEGDVLARDPRLVIVILGANDFFRKVPKAETFANMEKIVSRIQARGAAVAIGVVKIGLIGDVYTKEFKRIARERGAVFIPDVMKGILSDPKLKHDQIHPNGAGYKLIAERVYKTVAPLL
ncbi:MAG TPA: arylesterase [Candidatus Omnitrophota bacterium]|nr:arylesterase [Candidatus Omnitrophota bacterium]